MCLDVKRDWLETAAGLRTVVAKTDRQWPYLNLIRVKGNKSMSVWITILLILILAEVWWFGIHCTTYLSDIRDSLAKMTENRDKFPVDDVLSGEKTK